MVESGNSAFNNADKAPMPSPITRMLTCFSLNSAGKCRKINSRLQTCLNTVNVMSIPIRFTTPRALQSILANLALFGRINRWTSVSHGSRILLDKLVHLHPQLNSDEGVGGLSPSQTALSSRRSSIQWFDTNSSSGEVSPDW